MLTNNTKAVIGYTCEMSLACECTRAVLSVLVKCVFMHARTFLEENARAHAKIAKLLEKYSIIPRKKLVKACVFLRASVKLNLSCTVLNCVVIVSHYKYSVI